MTYQRKTKDEWQIQQNWGYGHKCETVYTADTYVDARLRLKEYSKNQRHIPIRIKLVRVKLENAK